MFNSLLRSGKLSDLTEEEKSSGKRRRPNVIHSRRKRERERIENWKYYRSIARDFREKNKYPEDENKGFEENTLQVQSKIAPRAGFGTFHCRVSRPCPLRFITHGWFKSCTVPCSSLHEVPAVAAAAATEMLQLQGWEDMIRKTNSPFHLSLSNCIANKASEIK
jgi:hypothetical protein